MDATEASTFGADVPRRKLSHREAVEKIRAADSLSVNLPGLGYVPVPMPANIAFYFGLALLVVTKFIDWPLVGPFGIDWPIAVFIALGHALTSRADRKAAATAAATVAAIDQLRTKIRRLDERFDEMLRRNGEADRAQND